SDSIRLFRVRFPVEAGLAFSLSSSSLSRFPFPAVPTLPDSVRSVSGSSLNPVAVEGAFAFRLIRLYQKQ
ncbi:hypothetical protein, partial [Streptomyces sp. NPDC096323]|uniref:hypothetical protein n=1 Tax=Streptomyces sp. NPDC096323 TaxID=3155822 RepID=UPI00331C8740